MSVERIFSDVHEDQLSLVVSSISPDLMGGDVIGLHGPMGSGKTTFVRQLCAEMGCTDWVNSPTYALIQAYETNRIRIIHVDLYRCSGAHDVDSLNLESYINSNTILLVEWASMWTTTAFSGHLFFDMKGHSTRQIRWLNNTNTN